MKIILPMAGRGQRYKKAGYETPKPLIKIEGNPMVLYALKSIEGLSFDQILVVCLEDAEKEYGISALLTPVLGDRLQMITIKEVTDGQLCTVLEAKQYLNPDDDVLIMASDTFIISDIGNDILNKASNCSGIISVTNLPGDQWSFAKTSNSGEVIQVAEKERISDNASTGMYYFSKAADLIKYGEQIIQNNERTRGEFYVMPVYQKMINDGHQISLSKASEMWDLGTPEAKQKFETYLNSK